MDALASLLVFIQSLGAVTGILFSALGEYFYVKAVRDGRVDAAERLHLLTASRGVRYGMTLVVLASFGLVITDYVRDVAVQPALTAEYWVFMTLTLTVIGFSWALSRKYVSRTLGSAITLSGWIFLVYMTLTRESVLSFGSVIALYAITTALLYAALHYFRSIFVPEDKVLA